MSDSPITLIVPEDEDGERLDRFLAESLPQFSREFLKSLILKNQVVVAGQRPNKPAFRLLEGQEIHLEIPPPQPLNLEAETIPLEIVYEDSDMLVVNKPSGMLTHPSGKSQTGTLVNALLCHCKGQLSGINGVERPGIVHRLDRETSGLLMVAKTDRAHQALQQQLQHRTAKRQYRAIVQGMMDQTSGTISAPIGRNPKHRDKMMIDAKGRPAVTHWEVLESLGHKFTILKLSLETGRTHQIRVHLASIGHPIFGDPLYGTGLEQQIRFHSQGQILQAFALTFQHPISGETLSFEIPPDEKFVAAKSFLEQWIQ